MRPDVEPAAAQPLPAPAASADPAGRAGRAPGFGGRLALGLVCGLVVYALFALWGDLGRVGTALAELPLWTVAAALALTSANYLVRFVRWELYRTRLGIRLERRTSFLIHLAGLALTVSPGKLGEAFKSWLIRRVDGTPLAKSAPIVLAERFTDLLGFLILIAIGGLSTAPEQAWIFQATLGLCALLLVFVSWPPATALALALVRRTPVVRRAADAIEVGLASARVLLAPRLLLVPTLLAAGGWALECTGFWLVASALVPGGVPFLFATFVFALGAVAGALALIVPGGLGVTEASLTTLLGARYTALGLARELAHAKAVAATIVIRLCTLWFAVLVGLCATLAFERHLARKAAAHAAPRAST